MPSVNKAKQRQGWRSVVFNVSDRLFYTEGPGDSFVPLGATAGESAGGTAGSKTLTYNQAGQLSQIEDVTGVKDLTYNASGQLVKIVQTTPTNIFTKEFVYNANGQLISITASNNGTYY